MIDTSSQKNQGTSHVERLLRYFRDGSLPMIKIVVVHGVAESKYIAAP